MNSRSRELSLLQINPDGQVLLQEEAATFLRALEGPLSIMAIVGPRHSGKSFLMNQIIGEKEAFNVCHGFDSPSKGLWVWTKPLLARDE